MCQFSSISLFTQSGIITATWGAWQIGLPQTQPADPGNTRWVGLPNVQPNIFLQTKPHSDVWWQCLAGKGHYGDVFLAKAHNIREGEPETLVVVKSLLARDEHHHFSFRQEMEMLAKLKHEHVVKLLGVCKEMDPSFLITEYCDWVRWTLMTAALSHSLRMHSGRD